MGDAPLLKEATSIDLTGKTIMPEIVNAHGHLGLLKGTKMSAANYTEDNIVRQLQQYQDYGVGRGAGDGDGPGHDVSMACAVARGHTARGTHLYSGTRLRRAGGGSAGEYGHRCGVSACDAGRSAQGRAGTGAAQTDVVKIWVDDFWGQYPKMKPEIYAAIIDEAHRHHLRVAAHIYHEEDAQKMVDLGVDILAHSVRDAEIPDSLVAEMKRKHVAYIGTMDLDEFMTAYEDDPAWLTDPFFRYALEPGGIRNDYQPGNPFRTTRRPRRRWRRCRLRSKTSRRCMTRAFWWLSAPTRVRRPSAFWLWRAQGVAVAGGGWADAAAGDYAGPQKMARSCCGLRASSACCERGAKANFIVLDRDPSEDIRNTESISSVLEEREEGQRRASSAQRIGRMSPGGRAAFPC